MKKALIMIMALIFIAGCGKETVEKSKEFKGVKVNNNKEIVKEQEKDGIKFTNTSLSSVNNHWTLVTTVTNNTENDYELEEFKIILKDNEGNIVTTLVGYVGDILPKGTKREINSGTYVDLTKVTSVEYEVVK